MRWAILAYVLLVGGAAWGADGTGGEFFESRIRPLLAEKCFKCHSAAAEKLKGGLYLDNREGLLKGGESGAVVVLGDPEKSKLIEAVRYTNVDLQMPPKGKLSDEQIGDLVRWVKMGAPWGGSISAAAPADDKKVFDLQ